MNDIPQPEESEQPEIKWLTLVLCQQAVNIRGRSTEENHHHLLVIGGID